MWDSDDGTLNIYSPSLVFSPSLPGVRSLELFSSLQCYDLLPSVTISTGHAYASDAIRGVLRQRSTMPDLAGHYKIWRGVDAVFLDAYSMQVEWLT